MEEKVNKKSMGYKIKIWRNEKGLTQDSLAKASGIPYTTLAKIETCVIKNPSIQTVIKIAHGLDISLDRLVK